jgi:hypothetical protein
MKVQHRDSPGHDGLVDFATIVPPGKQVATELPGERSAARTWSRELGHVGRRDQSRSRLATDEDSRTLRFIWVKGPTMTGTHGRWRALLVLLLGLLAPTPALAGPFFGDWSWCWHPSPDCPHGQYSPLHYWAPGVYKVRACVHPSNLDQYPPGPTPPVAPSYQYSKYGCPSIRPAPTSPYADPVGYYGRSVTPP